MDFRNNCLKFYIELCNSLLKKIDFENDFLKCVEVSAPDNVLKGKVRTISQLICFFPNIITSENAKKNK